MRMAETKVYSFNELSKDAKEKAIDYFRNNEDMPFLSEDMQEHLAELLKEYKLKYDELPKVYYSLSYSQGDGAMFEGTVFWKAYEVTIKQSGHYYHYNSKEFYVESAKTGHEASEEKHNEFNEIYVDICNKLERYGYDAIEYATSDDAIIENIEANEYEFTEGGKLW